MNPYLTHFFAAYGGAAFVTFFVVGGSFKNRIVSAAFWPTWPLWPG